MIDMDPLDRGSFRNYAVEQAIKLKPKADIDAILDIAEAIFQFAMQETQAQVYVLEFDREEYEFELGESYED